MADNKNSAANIKGEFIRNGRNYTFVILFIHQYSSYSSIIFS